MSVINEIAAERRRQIEVEGWSAEHDDQHSDRSLAAAAACYAAIASDNSASTIIQMIWPWKWEWWKPTSRRRNLIKAAALIVAEVERLDRAEIALAEKKP